jgi:hypothetical protein
MSRLRIPECQVVVSWQITGRDVGPLPCVGTDLDPVQRRPAMTMQ